MNFSSFLRSFPCLAEGLATFYHLSLGVLVASYFAFFPYFCSCQFSV